jgi:dTDP-4-amino-4,6-dideoxygalactose transaminase
VNTIPLFNLKAQLDPLKEEVFDAWEKVYRDCSFTHGKETEKFERDFADYCSVKHAVAVRSGTAALIISLKALEIKAGDEVITTAATFAATADAIVLVGAKPIFVDVQTATGNLDPELIEEKITSRTKAILVVHLYGVPCEMKSISKLARKYKLFLIEDSSHAHGSLYQGKKTGSLGTVGCFSLYPSKVLGSLGNAGVITVNSKSLETQVRMYANHGIKDTKHKYTHHVSGYNELIDNLQAAVLNIKFKKLETWINRKLKIANYYNDICRENNQLGMSWSPQDRPSLYLYSLQTKRRKELQDFLHKKNIETGVYYPTPLHLQPSMDGLKGKKGDLPNTEIFFKQTISLPCFPELKDDEIEYVGQALRKFFIR